MLSNKEWVYNEVSGEKIQKLSKQVGISSLMAKVFLNRRIDDVNYISRFLNPSMKDMHDPYLLKDMSNAVERIIKAIENREKIIVYGDYDVDGTTSTSILTDFLKTQNAAVDFYIPDRVDEGYGLSIAAIDKIKQTDVALIITVDCGITAIDEVKYIRDNNIDVVITDHHQCKEVLPEGQAVVNPCRPDCTYPFKHLAGVGVAYKLVQALCIKLGLGDYHKKYLDLVALGTVADVVPLVDENRVIVKYGLEKIENTENIGLRALVENSGLKDKAISSFGISFVLAPRINAAGRIGDAGRAVKLLTTDNEEDALSIALQLNEENKYRQDTELGILQQVIYTIQTEIDLNKDKVIVVDGDGWHHGIIGIVASKITERYYRPCILINNEEGVGKGSGRSIEGFNIFNALNYCKDLLEKFGGHELAAGLTLKTENIPEFRRMINQYADEFLDPYYLIPKLNIDVCINKDDISLENIKELDLLAPFGSGNPGPVFAYNGLKVSDIRTVGENKHLKLKLEDEGVYLDAIGFNMGSYAAELNSNKFVEVACTLEINTWNSVEKAQLNIKDIRPDSDYIIENMYYYTLENSLILDTEDSGCKDMEMANTFNRLETEDELISRITEATRGNKRVLLLANTLHDSKALDKILKKSAISIKKCCKICYTNSYDLQENAVIAIVNPDPNVLELKAYDMIVFYGAWIDGACFKRLVSKTELSSIYLYNTDDYSIDFKDIIPDRQDLVSVYQCIKECCRSSGNVAGTGKFVIEDLFAFSRRIAGLYNVKMNYFKLKKCIEVFEGLSLLEKSLVGEHGMKITMLNTKEKVNLESSRLYNNLQAFRVHV